MSRYAFVVCVSLLLLPLLFSAQTASASKLPYTRYEDVPQYLREILRQQPVREQYIAKILAEFRVHASSIKPLTRSLIDQAVAEKTQNERSNQLQRLIRFDQDFDTRVTADEIRKSIERQRSSVEENTGYVDRQVAEIMQLDANKDGVLDYAEMSSLKTLPLGTDHQQQSRVELMLAVDPDGDGALTLDELEAAARSAFSLVDTNHDADLSADEMKAVSQIDVRLSREVQQNRETQAIKAACPLPHPSDASRVFFLAGYGAKAVSPVYIGNQDADTGVISIEVPPNLGPIYLLVSSYEPTIWNITGATDQITQMAVLGSVDEAGRVSAGVTGIDKGRIVFANRTCISQDAWRPTRQGQINPAVITQLEMMLDRQPSVVSAAKSLGSQKISDEGFLGIRLQAFQPVRDGFDEAIWAEALRFKPYGIIDIDDKAVVSPVSAGRYDVMPEWFGISQLVKAGVLKPAAAESSKPRHEVILPDGSGVAVIEGNPTIELPAGAHLRVMVGNSFDVVKDMPRYPSGLYGAVSVKFNFMPGVKLPAGNPGHSCVTQNGEPVGDICSGANQEEE